MAKVSRTKAIEPASPEEINLLRSLEKAERRILLLVGKKEAYVELHNEAIKAAKKDRRAVLDALDDYQNGVRGLPLDE